MHGLKWSRGYHLSVSAAVPEFAGLVHGGCGYKGAVIVEQSIEDLCSVFHEGMQFPTRGVGVNETRSASDNPSSRIVEVWICEVLLYLKKHDKMLQSGVPLSTVVHAALNSITENQCNSWITHSV